MGEGEVRRGGSEEGGRVRREGSWERGGQEGRGCGRVRKEGSWERGRSGARVHYELLVRRGGVCKQS